MKTKQLWQKVSNLKKIFRFVTRCVVSIVLLWILGCEHDHCVTNPVNHVRAKIYGSGNLTTVVRELPAFHSINHTTVGQVDLTYGDTQKVAITVDDNILKYVKTRVSNGELTISIQSDTSLSNFNLSFDITMTVLKKLTTSSAGNIYGQNKFYADQVNFDLFSAGNINLDIEADEIRSDLYSAGNLFLKGSAARHFANLYSAGNLNTFSLTTDTTYITLNSAGNGYVHVLDYLDAKLNSAGSLYYTGHPQIVQQITSAGRIFDAN